MVGHIEVLILSPITHSCIAHDYIVVCSDRFSSHWNAAF